MRNEYDEIKVKINRREHRIKNAVSNISICQKKIKEHEQRIKTYQKEIEKAKAELFDLNNELEDLEKRADE
ncbi:MAG: hypothetical protein II961_00410 [Candidatus Riflebacteria bacterium]|nr:hypothetical protein [Candidatus Riflebacteria bacterium]